MPYNSTAKVVLGENQLMELVVPLFYFSFSLAVLLDDR
jgi:hypothetical protein